MGIGRGDKRQRECTPQREGEIRCKKREATTAVPQEQERLRMMPQQSTIVLEDRHRSTRE